jgi:hypothetical protein
LNQLQLNSTYHTLTMRRRYEVWFLKLLLADKSGAWWFRYLLTNLGRAGCSGASIGNLDFNRRQPVQLWATWFPRDAAPQSFIHGLPLDSLQLSKPSEPLALQCSAGHLSHAACQGHLTLNGHNLAWDLQYHSTAGFSLSHVGWIGFSRTPHSDAIFTGEINLDGQVFRGLTPEQPLGYGLQGHNCGFRHRNRWTWAHCFARTAVEQAITFEALEYEIGFGLYFRRAQLWRNGQLYTLKHFTTHRRDRERMLWHFDCADNTAGLTVTAELDGGGPSLHRLPYLKTDCSGSFEVSNNSLAQAALTIRQAGQEERLTANAGAVLEMVGE